MLALFLDGGEALDYIAARQPALVMVFQNTRKGNCAQYGLQRNEPDRIRLGEDQGPVTVLSGDGRLQRLAGFAGDDGVVVAGDVLSITSSMHAFAICKRAVVF